MLRRLFSASVELSDINTLPILAMKQFLSFTQVNSIKKTQIGVVGLGEIIAVYINNLKCFEAIQLLACLRRGLEKAQSKALRHGIERSYASADELIQDAELS
ncbi:MAG: hypothetical protein P8O70_08405 [SAR324 cluster bacterium]|nr:hypothetical protein [SAR324 cluster bacterium]